MDIAYTKCGNHYLPNIALSATTHYRISKYGRMRRSFLMEHQSTQYSDLALAEMLFPHLMEINEVCHQRLKIMTSKSALPLFRRS